MQKREVINLTTHLINLLLVDRGYFNYSPLEEVGVGCEPRKGKPSVTAGRKTTGPISQPKFKLGAFGQRSYRKGKRNADGNS